MECSKNSPNKNNAENSQTVSYIFPDMKKSSGQKIYNVSVLDAKKLNKEGVKDKILQLINKKDKKSTHIEEPASNLETHQEDILSNSLPSSSTVVSKIKRKPVVNIISIEKIDSKLTKTPVLTKDNAASILLELGFSNVSLGSEISIKSGNENLSIQETNSSNKVLNFSDLMDPIVKSLRKFQSTKIKENIDFLNKNDESSYENFIGFKDDEICLSDYNLNKMFAVELVNKCINTFDTNELQLCSASPTRIEQINPEQVTVKENKKIMFEKEQNIIEDNTKVLHTKAQDIKKTELLEDLKFRKIIDVPVIHNLLTSEKDLNKCKRVAVTKKSNDSIINDVRQPDLKQKNDTIYALEAFNDCQEIFTSNEHIREKINENKDLNTSVNNINKGEKGQSNDDIIKKFDISTEQIFLENDVEQITTVLSKAFKIDISHEAKSLLEVLLPHLNKESLSKVLEAQLHTSNKSCTENKSGVIDDTIHSNIKSKSMKLENEIMSSSKDKKLENFDQNQQSIQTLMKSDNTLENIKKNHKSNIVHVSINSDNTTGKIVKSLSAQEAQVLINLDQATENICKNRNCENTKVLINLNNTLENMDKSQESSDYAKVLINLNNKDGNQDKEQYCDNAQALMNLDNNHQKIVKDQNCYNTQVDTSSIKTLEDINERQKYDKPEIIVNLDNTLENKDKNQNCVKVHVSRNSDDISDNQINTLNTTESSLLVLDSQTSKKELVIQEVKQNSFRKKSIDCVSKYELPTKMLKNSNVNSKFLKHDDIQQKEEDNCRKRKRCESIKSIDTQSNNKELVNGKDFVDTKFQSNKKLKNLYKGNDSKNANIILSPNKKYKTENKVMPLVQVVTSSRGRKIKPTYKLQEANLSASKKFKNAVNKSKENQTEKKSFLNDSTEIIDEIKISKSEEYELKIPAVLEANQDSVQYGALSVENNKINDIKADEPKYTSERTPQKQGPTNLPESSLLPQKRDQESISDKTILYPIPVSDNIIDETNPSSIVQDEIQSEKNCTNILILKPLGIESSKREEFDDLCVSEERKVKAVDIFDGTKQNSIQELSADNNKTNGKLIYKLLLFVKNKPVDEICEKWDIICGFCKKHVLKEQWFEHLGTHYGFGWVENEQEPLDPTCFSVVKGKISEYHRKFNNILKCRICDMDFSDAKELITHLKECYFRQNIIYTDEYMKEIDNVQKIFNKEIEQSTEIQTNGSGNVNKTTEVLPTSYMHLFENVLSSTPQRQNKKTSKKDKICDIKKHAKRKSLSKHTTIESIPSEVVENSTVLGNESQLKDKICDIERPAKRKSLSKHTTIEPIPSEVVGNSTILGNESQLKDKICDIERPSKRKSLSKHSTIESIPSEVVENSNVPGNESQLKDKICDIERPAKRKLLSKHTTIESIPSEVVGNSTILGNESQLKDKICDIERPAKRKSLSKHTTIESIPSEVVGNSTILGNESQLKDKICDIERPSKRKSLSKHSTIESIPSEVVENSNVPGNESQLKDKICDIERPAKRKLLSKHTTIESIPSEVVGNSTILGNESQLKDKICDIERPAKRKSVSKHTTIESIPSEVVGNCNVPGNEPQLKDKICDIERPAKRKSVSKHTAIESIPSEVVGNSNVLEDESQLNSIESEINDVEFHPQLLLITKREDLNKPIIKVENTKLKPSEIRCGFCKSVLCKLEWKSHLLEHYCVGWLEGEEPIIVNSYKNLVKHITNNMKVNKIKSLKCRLCNEERKSAIGILTHLDICGLSDDDTSKNKIICKYCSKKYHKIPLIWHYRACSARNKKKVTQFVTVEEQSDLIESSIDGQELGVDTSKKENENNENLNISNIKQKGRKNLDIALHPRLLLVNTRQDLEKEFKEENRKPLKNEVKCGFCKIIVLKDNWTQHLGSHYGIGWIEGTDEPYNVCSYNTVLNRMISFMKTKKITSLKCRMCNEVRKSALGMLSHLEICGLTNEEIDKIRIECENCHKKFLESVLGTHYKNCFNKKEESIISDDLNASDGNSRLKRKSLIRAEKKLKCLKEQHYDFNVDDHIKQLNRADPRGLTIKLNAQLNSQGVLKCFFNKCSFSTQDVSQMQSHLKTCLHKEKTIFYKCLICGYENENNAEVRIHVENEHSKNCENNLDDNKDYELDTDSTDDSYISKIDFKKVKSRNFNWSKQCKLWMDTFIEDNFSNVPLYIDAIPKYNQLASDILSNFIKQSCTSLKFSYEKSSTVNKMLGSSEIPNQWQEMKIFESTEIDDNQIIYLGNPITNVAWVPVNSKENDQYLAVSCKPEFKSANGIDASIFQTFVYIFKITKTQKPKIQYAFNYDCGPIYQMKFLPSGGYAPNLNRLGLIAIASAKLEIEIFSLPIDLQQNVSNINKSIIVLDLKPCMCLKLINDNKDQEFYSDIKKYHCTRVEWSEYKNHNIIAAGFTNGGVALWNIMSNDNITKFEEAEIMYFRPISVFQPANQHILSINFHYNKHGIEWLIVTSQSRALRIYDVKDVSKPFPIFKENISKGEPKSTVWPIFWANPLCIMGENFIGGPYGVYVISSNNINFKLKYSLKTPGSQTSISFNPYFNSAVVATNNGDIFIQKYFDMHWNVVKKKNNPSIMWYTDIVKLDSTPLPLRNTPREEEDELFEENYKEKYGILFSNLIRVPTSDSKTVTSSQRDTNLFLSYYTAINTIAWNINKGYETIIASGYNNGFLRILKFQEKYLD